ncbi:hypothetical protein CLHOM_15990 [Clostridium homopropionicum DSM 5847]|uniref:Uncharacterized protein n=1 Tax=Clostridium homopropionicum DSM 5847 TaxID=1121318 RepID=A0A0L6ZAN0_9CLOT|nr:hypothetical protein [Clostridium homopropionicum]KOA20034.1 hypothetical protein CLHOM_15990 [Clostridium homopropionicum DSM 5847]SFG65354.1 hypothetical protein SAMN04488501_11274 [Clostridium homopropionicum]
MNIKDKEKFKLSNWKKMKDKGKKLYIWKTEVLYRGFLIGIVWALLFQITEEGFKFNSLMHLSFLRRLLIGIVIFSVGGCFYALLTWRKYERRYTKVSMEVIKEIFSPSRKYKAEVIKREDGLFHVDVCKWDEEWETWLQVSRGFSLTDTEENAIKIAIEKLRNSSGEAT